MIFADSFIVREIIFFGAMIDTVAQCNGRNGWFKGMDRIID
jgi:hypothetical protein